MIEVQRGEVWWGEVEGLGRRPFLIVTRPAAIPVLSSVLAAPLTRNLRHIPSELPLGPEDGMPTECAASFDKLRTVPKANLVERACTLSPDRMAQACLALRTATGC